MTFGGLEEGHQRIQLAAGLRGERTGALRGGDPCPLDAQTLPRAPQDLVRGGRLGAARMNEVPLCVNVGEGARDPFGAASLSRVEQRERDDAAR